MRFLKDLKKQSIKSAIGALIAACIVVTLALFTLCISPDTVAVEDISYAQIGSYGKATISEFIPLYEFASEEDDGTTMYYFIISVTDVNDESYFMALKTTSDTKEKIYEIYDTDEVNTTNSEISLFGSISELSSEEKEYFDDGLEELGFQEDYSFTYYCFFDDGLTEAESRNGDIVYAIIMLVISAILFIFPVKAFLGLYQKKLIATASTMGNSQQMLEWLDQFYYNTNPVYGMRLHPSLLLFQNKRESILLPANNLVWVYPKQTNRKYYGIIPLGSTHSVVLKTSDKKEYNITVKNQEAASDLCMELGKLYPQVRVGYNFKGVPL